MFCQRLLPLYATTVFFYATLLPKLGSGPVWNFVIKLESDQCRDYWWVNLLFLNNYLGGHKMVNVPQGAVRVRTKRIAYTLTPKNITA